MNNGYVAVIDSGIGGFSVLSEMLKIMPNENYIYFGDNQNAPYGNRTNSDLFSITMQNLMYLHTFNIKAIVFGCNTISTNLLSKVAYYFPDTAFFWGISTRRNEFATRQKGFNALHQQYCKKV